MKVYGLTVFAPAHWPIERADNGNRQVRVVAQVRSKRELIELLASHGIRETLHGLKHSCGETGNDAELMAAGMHPGELLRHTQLHGTDAPVLAERAS